MKRFFNTLLIVFCSCFSAYGQTLYVNEISNGPGGSKEFIELVVDAGACGTMDLRGYIIDDNNGADDGSCQGFSTSTTTGMGIARGHYMFDSIPAWQNIPNGSIILIYNSLDKNPKVPADDEDDTSPHDSIYILPITSSKIKRCTSIPSGPAGNCNYKGQTYIAPTAWTSIGMRNSGDAGQVRYPDGSYCHGISYGSSMTGGPDNLKVWSSSGSGKCFYFNDGDYRNVANFSVGTAGSANETPGDFNNAQNEAYIRNFRKCTLLPLPASIRQSCQSGNLLLEFELPEFNNSSYVLEWQDSKGRIQEADRLEGGVAGLSNSLYGANAYQYPLWRIAEERPDGTVEHSPWKVNKCHLDNGEISFRQSAGNISLKDARYGITYYLISSDGQVLSSALSDSEGSLSFELPGLINGFYMIVSDDRLEVLKFSVVK